MNFKIFYCIYFIACLFYSPVMVFGPVSVRHILTGVMLVLCFFEGAKIDKFLKWYFIFLFFCLISALSTGYLGVFFNKLLGTYLAALVLYLATKVMIVKYQAQKWVLYAVLVVACMNSVVAIAQFYNLTFAIFIPDFLGIQLEEDMIEYYERFEDFHGRYVGGLLGVVNSGYFLSAACVLSLCSVTDKTKIWNWFIFILNFYALYLVQQRAGFFIGLMCVAVYVIITMARSRRERSHYIVLMILAVAFIGYFGTQMFFFDEMRYSTQGMVDVRRYEIAYRGWQFFIENPLGGIYAFRATGNLDPHNLFVNAMLYGGIIGGLLILGYIIYQMVFVGNVMIKTFSRRRYSSLLLAFSLAYLCYTLNSLFHNSSLVYGEAMYFLLWGGVTSLLEIEDGKKRKPVYTTKSDDLYQYYHHFGRKTLG